MTWQSNEVTNEQPVSVSSFLGCAAAIAPGKATFMSAHACFFLPKDLSRKMASFSEFLRLVSYNFTEGDTWECILSFVIGYWEMNWPCSGSSRWLSFQSSRSLNCLPLAYCDMSLGSYWVWMSLQIKKLYFLLYYQQLLTYPASQSADMISVLTQSLWLTELTSSQSADRKSVLRQKPMVDWADQQPLSRQIGNQYSRRNLWLTELAVTN